MIIPVLCPTLLITPRLEVLSAADGVRRRYWSDEDKLRIVEENYIGHRQGTATACHHGICRSLLTIWRRQYRDGELGGSSSASFAPVTVTTGVVVSHRGAVKVGVFSGTTQVEIVLTNGHRLIMSVNLDPDGLVRTLSAMGVQ